MSLVTTHVEWRKLRLLIKRCLKNETFAFAIDL